MRPRLQKLLGEAVNFPLVAVYAGSGYGKTRTVYSFLQESEADTTWMQLSRQDNVETRFWENFTHMINLSWPEAGTRLLGTGFPDTEEAFAEFEALMMDSKAVQGNHIMVYDDFHLLQNTAVLGFFERSVTLLPQGSTVILISRTVPEIDMVGMMLREQIFTVSEDDLRFTEDEIAAYFKQLALPVSREYLRDIYKDTLGWAFAINLIGRSISKDSKYERYALKAMKENVFKLIEREVSQNISETLWRFLLRISLIDHLSAELIKTLAMDGSLIEEMERFNAFIYYDSHLDAYTIHHMFLDYLRQNQYMLTEVERRETYQKAGRWCENHNYQLDALSYYEKSGDYDTIIQIADYFNTHIPLDTVKHVLEIFDRMPEYAMKNLRYPITKLKLKIRVGSISEAYELAAHCAEEYEYLPESAEKNNIFAEIYSSLGLLRLIMCTDTDVYDFDVYFNKLRIYYDKSPYSVPFSAVNQSVGAWALPIGYNRAGAPEEYIEAMSRSIPHISRALVGNPYGLDDLARGELCFFRRELGEAERHLKQALIGAQTHNQYDVQNRALLYLMRIAFFRGDFSAAGTLLQSMKELLDKPDYVIRFKTYDVATGYYHLMLGQPDQVPDWLKGDFDSYTHPMFIENYINLLKAQYHYQTRQFSALLAFIESERERQTVLLGKIELRVLEALSLYQIKCKPEALCALTEAYYLAAPNDFTNAFVQHAKDMRTLTAAALRDNTCLIPRPWLENINRKASAFAKRQSHMISEYRSANKIGDEISLTRRELEILRDLVQGLSRTEIAASQNISINTAKMVINSVYDKLCANNLADAIRIAVDRGMV